MALCEQQAWSSVAFPVIGPGVVLAMPVQYATNILVGEIETFGLAASIGSLRTIQIVIMPNYSDSEQVREYHLCFRHRYNFVLVILTNDL